MYTNKKLVAVVAMNTVVYCSRLHVAAMRNKFDVVQLLIAYSANITAVDFQGRTALHCASRHGASEVLEVLTQVCVC